MIVRFLFTAGVLWFASVVSFAAELSLAGAWRVSPSDPADRAAEWREISLPGTLDDAGIGQPLTLEPKLDSQVLARLQRKFTHVGQAWYSREIVIPKDWEGRRIQLYLERVLWESRVSVDGVELSRQDSLCTPHRHALGMLKAGRHQLLICVDNREIHPGISRHAKSFTGPGDGPLAHAYTNHTQTMWNGVLGKMILQSQAPGAMVEKLDVFPRLAPSPGMRVRVELSNNGGNMETARMHLILKNAGGEIVARTERTAVLAKGVSSAEFDWELDERTVRAWGEFNPDYYRLEVTLDGQPDASREVQFGFRELAAKDGSFFLNGKRIFMRGTLECAAFPLTGYPPATVDEWKRIISRAREWGLNHLRFHSWCPPEAAFQAADELGFYLQVELPFWSHAVGENKRSWQFIEDEASRILAEYGNHPSFMLLSLGNELQGEMSLLENLTRKLRANDGRRLYSTTTFTFAKGYGRAPAASDEFFITRRTEKGWVRGQGIFNTIEPSFDGDYNNETSFIKTPLITHEIGQYSVYPDLSEIDRYKGNLVPLNFVAVKNDLDSKGLLKLAPSFARNTGLFSAILYKEEIERALRTSHLDGFQLLGLQDFPGQGTALVGLLNAFWESKNIISAEKFRQFCGPLVPLVRISKATFECGDTLDVTFELANFFKDFSALQLDWRLVDGTGKVEACGSLGPVLSDRGGLARAGNVKINIPGKGDAGQWTLEARVTGTDFRNSWQLWIYPKKSPPEPSTVVVSSDLDKVQRALSAGKTVLYNPPVDQINGIEGRFLPVFWSPFHSPEKQSGTMGILCDPAHPALAKFPTESHSNWQWWDITLRARSVVLDGLSLTPIVRTVDNFKRNHSLGLIFEARVGRGKIIFCASDITNGLEKRMVARQLRASLLAYMASEKFSPEIQITAGQLAAFIITK